MRKPDWFRMAHDMFDNPKIMRARDEGGDGAVILYLRGLGYISHNLTDGWIPAAMPKHWHHKPRQVKALVDACLWYEVPVPDALPGWLVHDWEHYQPSRADWEVKSEKARISAQARWAGKPFGT